jgi:hypothetical protein
MALEIRTVITKAYYWNGGDILNMNEEQLRAAFLELAQKYDELQARMTGLEK